MRHLLNLDGCYDQFRKLSGHRQPYNLKVKPSYRRLGTIASPYYVGEIQNWMVRFTLFPFSKFTTEAAKPWRIHPPASKPGHEMVKECTP
jgi:hypothetical protein